MPLCFIFTTIYLSENGTFRGRLTSDEGKHKRRSHFYYLYSPVKMFIIKLLHVQVMAICGLWRENKKTKTVMISHPVSVQGVLMMFPRRLDHHPLPTVPSSLFSPIDRLVIHSPIDIIMSFFFLNWRVCPNPCGISPPSYGRCRYPA